jgi:hypothetical protein
VNEKERGLLPDRNGVEGIEGTSESETCRNKSRLPLHLSRAAPKSTLVGFAMVPVPA